jgi:hypothetical protein
MFDEAWKAATRRPPIEPMHVDLREMELAFRFGRRSSIAENRMNEIRGSGIIARDKPKLPTLEAGMKFIDDERKRYGHST